MRRRGSLFGPIIIILFGTMFLVHNFRPDIEVWNLFGQYWPLLLIFLGLLKLIQTMSPQDPAQPARPLLTGGEVFLVILLCFIGVAIFKGGRIVTIDDAVWPDIFGQDYSYTQEVKQAVSEAQPDIVVINPGGDVTIEGADIKEIEVKADKHVRATSDDEGKRVEGQANIQITRDGSQYVVRSEAPTTRGRISYRAALDIRVPKGATVKVDAKHGDVKVRDIAGAVNITVDRGNVELADVGGNARLDIRRGSLTAQRVKGGVEMDGRGDDIQVTDIDGDVIVRGEYGGNIAFANLKKVLRFTSSRTDMEIQKLPGKLDMSLGSLTITEPGGAVTVRTSSKDIRIDDFDGSVHLSDRDAGIELSTKKALSGDIDVDNKTGHIELSLPASSRFQIDASARSGDVSTEFSDVSNHHDNDNGTMNGTVGKGGPNVKLYTTHGNISLRKGS
jgi:DUF4097 and DUF4098 domain-containing protein YvlB